MQSERNAVVSLIAVYKSLGGGWSFEPAGTATQPGGESRYAAVERTPGEWAR